jgi:hypothetical protein
MRRDGHGTDMHGAGCSQSNINVDARYSSADVNSFHLGGYGGGIAGFVPRPEVDEDMLVRQDRPELLGASRSKRCDQLRHTRLLLPTDRASASRQQRFQVMEKISS